MCVFSNAQCPVYINVQSKLILKKFHIFLIQIIKSEIWTQTIYNSTVSGQ